MRRGRRWPGRARDNIAVQTDYVDVNAILASLHYTAGSGAGADTIQFEAWNQAGVETTASTAVTIDAASFQGGGGRASSNMVADFGSGGGSAAGASTPDDTSGGSSGSLALDDVVTHPIGIPVTAGG